MVREGMREVRRGRRWVRGETRTKISSDVVDLCRVYQRSGVNIWPLASKIQIQSEVVSSAY